MLRRITVLILVSALMCSLSGCIYFEVDKTYELLYGIDEIESIYIHQTTNGYIPTDSTAYEVAAADYDSFVSDLTGLHFTEGYLIVLAAVDPSFNYGQYAVQIIYKNGGYDIISDGGYQEYCNADGKTHGRHYDCESEDWEAFIQKYLPTQ